MGKRISIRAAMIVLLFVFIFTTASGATGTSIVEVESTDTHVTAYVKGVEGVTSVSASMGQTSSPDVEYKLLSESGVPIRTIILVDNSLSIPVASRTATKELLSGLVSARRDNEVFAVGTISESVNVTQEFTDNVETLNAVIDSMEYANQETYLTDALYDYITATGYGTANSAFDRMLIVSDGVDNKALGYTKDELLSLLKTTPVPIYTIGVANNSTSNNDELENMFAIARATNANSAMLTDLDAAGLTEMLSADQSNIVVTAEIPEQVMDGGTRTLTVNLTSGDSTATVSMDGVRMPYQEHVEPEPEPDTSQDTEPEPDSEPIEIHTETQTETVIERTEVEKIPLWLLIVIIAIGVIVVAGIVIVIVMVVKHKKKQDPFTRIDSEQEKRMREYEGGTVLVNDVDGGDGETIRIWGETTAARITLTDIHDLQRCYQKPITSSLRIGFSPESDICIQYDQSVSRKQCDIIKEGSDFFIVNLSQSNGTLLNGMRVTEKMPIYDGSIIKMGRVEMRVEIVQ